MLSLSVPYTATTTTKLCVCVELDDPTTTLTVRAQPRRDGEYAGFVRSFAQLFHVLTYNVDNITNGLHFWPRFWGYFGQVRHGDCLPSPRACAGGWCPVMFNGRVRFVSSTKVSERTPCPTGKSFEGQSRWPVKSKKATTIFRKWMGTRSVDHEGGSTTCWNLKTTS